MVLALILTLVLACQARTLAAALRARRLHASARPPRITELAWVALPVAVVLFLAARSFIVALDLNPGTASVAPITVSARPASPPIVQR